MAKSSLEKTMAQDEFETSQANIMGEVNQPPQEELIFENEVDELAISIAELAKTRAELCMEETKANVQFQSIPLKSLEETITPKTTSHTQSVIKIEQHPQRKEYRGVNGSIHEEGTTKELPYQS